MPNSAEFCNGGIYHIKPCNFVLSVAGKGHDFHRPKWRQYVDSDFHFICAAANGTCLPPDYEEKLATAKAKWST